MPWTPSRARRATPTTSQSNGARQRATSRPIEPWPRMRTRSAARVAHRRRDPTRGAPAPRHRRRPAWRRRGSPPRPTRPSRGRGAAGAAQRHAGGTRSAIQSTPAERTCTTRSAGSVRGRRGRSQRARRTRVATGAGHRPPSSHPVGRRAERLAGRGPRRSRGGQHARPRGAQALEQVGDLGVAAVERSARSAGLDRVARRGRCARARARSAPRPRRTRGRAASPARSAVTSPPRSPARW